MYESVEDKDKKLMINFSYANVAEREDGLGQTMMISCNIVK